jgi:hypothetical protein
MAIAALIPVAVTVGSSLLNTANKDDPNRFAQSQAWYYAAVQGDAVALCKLKYMGGSRGCAPGGCGGAQTCGFATVAAKTYNEQLYQQALSVLSGAQPQSTPLPQSPQPSAALPPAITTPINTAIGQQQQQQQLENAKNIATALLPWVVVIGGGALLVYMVIRSRR